MHPSKAPDLGKGLPARARWSAVAIGVAVTVWSAFTYEGPYRWLSELQLAVFGRYFVQLTFLLVLFACVLVALGFAQLARRLRLVPSATPVEVVSEQTTADRLNERMAVAQGPLTILVMGLVLIFVGGRDLWRAEQGGTLKKLEAAQLERGAPLTSTWLELHGALLHDGAVEAEAHGTKHLYVPLVSEAWKPGVRLGVLIKLPASEDPGPAPYRGAIDPEGLPGMVRAAYEDAGIDAGQAVVLELGKRPLESVTKANWFFGAGLLLALVGAVVLRRRLAR